MTGIIWVDVLINIGTAFGGIFLFYFIAWLKDTVSEKRYKRQKELAKHITRALRREKEDDYD
jgi:hypothetical protein